MGLALERAAAGCAAGTALPGQELPRLPVQPGAGVRHRHPGLEHTHRLQWPDFARPRRVLCLWRLHRGHPDGQVGRALLGHLAGGLRGVLRVRLPGGLSGLAVGGALLGAGHLRAGPGSAATAQVQTHRAPHRRRAGHRAEQARAAVQLPLPRPAPQCRPLAVLLHAGRGRADVPAGLEPAARPGGPGADRRA